MKYKLKIINYEKNVIKSLFTISLIAMLFCFQSCKKSDNDNSPSLENISGIWKIISNNGRTEKAPYDYVVISKNSLKFNSYTNETGKLAIKCIFLPKLTPHSCESLPPFRV